MFPTYRDRVMDVCMSRTSFMGLPGTLVTFVINCWPLLFSIKRGWGIWHRRPRTLDAAPDKRPHWQLHFLLLCCRRPTKLTRSSLITLPSLWSLRSRVRDIPANRNTDKAVDRCMDFSHWRIFNKANRNPQAFHYQVQWRSLQVDQIFRPFHPNKIAPTFENFILPY
jgi:hypothetical protein